jgi:hypothetical protein
MTVLVEDDRVLLVSPPGESAVLSARQTRRRHTLLDEVAYGSGLAARDRLPGEELR